MTAIQTKKKSSKSYILSNNVVINLAPTKRQRRRQQSKPKQPSGSYGPMPPGYSTTKQPAFTNISNLETQALQAKLEQLENGNKKDRLETQALQAQLENGDSNTTNDRFQNNSKLIDYERIDASVRNTLAPFIYRFNTTAEQKFRNMDIAVNTLRNDVRDMQPDDDEEDNDNVYFKKGDNYGAFGTIEGSDSFPAHGNNIPDTEQNNDKTKPPATPQQKDEQLSAEEDIMTAPIQQSNEFVITVNPKNLSPLKTRQQAETQGKSNQAQPFNITLDIPAPLQDTVGKIINKSGKTIVADRDELLAVYSFLMGSDQSTTVKKTSALQTAIKNELDELIKDKAMQMQIEEASKKPLYFDYGFG